MRLNGHRPSFRKELEVARKTAAATKKSAPSKRSAASNGSSRPFGVALEARMHDKGISYRALAEKTGLSAGYLNHLVHGNRPVPANAVIQSIAKAVGMKADSFREFRIRKVSEALAKKPELVDKVYVDIVKGK
jgi:lambda repressor-like predicted transcriptional regulator